MLHINKALRNLWLASHSFEIRKQDSLMRMFVIWYYNIAAAYMSCDVIASREIALVMYAIMVLVSFLRLWHISSGLMSREIRGLFLKKVS